MKKYIKQIKKNSQLVYSFLFGFFCKISIYFIIYNYLFSLIYLITLLNN